MCQESKQRSFIRIEGDDFEKLGELNLMSSFIRKHWTFNEKHTRWRFLGRYSNTSLLLTLILNMFANVFWLFEVKNYVNLTQQAKSKQTFTL